MDLSRLIPPVLKYMMQSSSDVDFCVHNPPGGYSIKIVNNGVVYPYPSRSVVYNAVVSGPAAAECTLWVWAWLAKNCAQVKCRLKDTAELSC